jgi:hypothetical protein
MITTQEERFAFLPEKVRAAFFLRTRSQISPGKHLKTRGNARVFFNTKVFSRAENTGIFMAFEVWGVPF